MGVTEPKTVGVTDGALDERVEEGDCVVTLMGSAEANPLGLGKAVGFTQLGGCG